MISSLLVENLLTVHLGNLILGQKIAITVKHMLIIIVGEAIQ